METHPWTCPVDRNLDSRLRIGQNCTAVCSCALAIELYRDFQIPDRCPLDKLSINTHTWSISALKYCSLRIMLNPKMANNLPTNYISELRIAHLLHVSEHTYSEEVCGLVLP